ncbi:MAG: acetylornithine/succinylornithine family transaminase [Opitutae bacterium]|nr:acetylornithine/succinylornithine family transaminase [Opitutae bacterium]
MINPEHNQYLVSNYAPPPLEIISGKGSYLWDSKGSKFLDFTSGIAVTNIGHTNSHWVDSVKKQINELVHCSNLFSIPQQVKLAKRIVEKIGPGKMLFCNSGAEANEALIKFSRLVGNKTPENNRFKLLVAENGFHGRTMGALSATSSPKYRMGFEPLLEGFEFAPLNNIEAFKSKIDKQTIGIMVESIQGEGGIRVASDEFLLGIEELCKENGLLLLLDEVQAGIGRTGEFLGYQKSGITPDAIAIAKGLGSGFPIGGIWLAEKWGNIFQPGSHGTTFGGSPLACSAANAVLDIIENENLVDSAKEKGSVFAKGLMNLKNNYPNHIEEIRGRGLMLAMAMKAPPTSLIENMRDLGLLVVGAAENVIRFLPPLTVSESEMNDALRITEAALQKLCQKPIK